MIRARIVAAALPLALLTWASRGRAEPQAAEPQASEAAAPQASAEALFDEGRSLMKEERYDEACAKFEASQKLDPGVGTLLNLGDCLERAGRTASAWARFREAAAFAAVSSQAERELAARQRALALEGRLVRLVVRPSREAAVDVGLHIVRDGIPLDRQAWGVAIPVDPGPHVVRATSPGKVSWSTELRVDEGGGTRAVEVPVLRPDPSLVPSPPSRASHSGSSQRTVAVIIGGLGVASFGASAGFAIDAKSTYDDAARRCTSLGCDSIARDRANGAGGTADVATGFFIGGVVALAAGVVLYLTAPRSPSSPPPSVVGLAFP